ncbi:MAG: hypothetical protein QOG63_61 [Thermoleophilaceae bacterium]|nr:hypothetical protein [Thermoleophilaceae bacterium]
MSARADAGERVRTLLLRGDNVLKSARPERLGRALEAFEEARSIAADPSVDPRVRELVERRIESVRALLEGA